SLTMVVGLVTGITVPGLAGRFADQRPLMLACCALTAGGLAGVLLAPMSVPYLWTVLLGLGQNAAFPLALMLIVGRAGDVPHTEALSTMTQSIGYVLGAFGPLAAGAIHGATGSWTASLIVLLAIGVREPVLGLRRSPARRRPAGRGAGGAAAGAGGRRGRDGVALSGRPRPGAGVAAP